MVSVVLAAANAVKGIMLVYHDVQMALVVGLSLIATVIISKLIGCVPLLAGKIHLDPAIMAAPLITTIVDTCSVIAYFRLQRGYLLCKEKVCTDLNWQQQFKYE